MPAMVEELLRVLAAIAALLVPMGFAWLVLWRTARRHPHRPDRPDRPDRHDPR
jgi:hypothetical protein